MRLLLPGDRRTGQSLAPPREGLSGTPCGLAVDRLGYCRSAEPAGRRVDRQNSPPACRGCYDCPMTAIRIVEPSGVPDQTALDANIKRLCDAGFSVLYTPTTRHPDFPMSADSANARAIALQNALTEDSSQIVYAARGGYGASELLPLLDFDRIARAPAPEAAW